jgi:hypothetical protein
MKTMRQILQDRFWSGAIAVSIAYLMIFQSLCAALAQGAMAAAPQYVICTSKGLVAADPAPGGGMPGSEPPPWRCVTLCQLASTAAPAVFGAEASFAYAFPQWVTPAYFPPSGRILPASAPGLIAEARAPPRSM